MFIGEIVLRKDFLVSALVLLFIGIVIVSVTVNIKRRITISETEVEKKTSTHLDKTARSWSISGNYSKGEKLYVVIQPGDNWYGEPQEAGPYAILKLPVSINDPLGRETKVYAVFMQQIYPTTGPLQLDHVELNSSSEGLTFEEVDKAETVNGTGWYNRLWAIVEFDGNYTVTVSTTWGVVGPPRLIELKSLVVGWEYPYWFVTVAGGCLVFIALLLLWIGIWKSRQPKFRYKVKTDVKKKLFV